MDPPVPGTYLVMERLMLELCFLLVQLWFYFIIDLVLINIHLFYAVRQFGT